MKGFLLGLLIFASLLALLSGNSGCASIVPPTGGDRDSLPPVLRNASPKDSTLRFSNRTITFTFNEYLGDLADLQNNLLISPTPERLPEVTVKLRTLNVKFKDSLEANTTYSINFGNAIKDFTEGNILKDFTYIFSTGNTLDSLELEGKVLLAETGKTDTTLIVMLHTSGEDSAVVNKRPRYVAKLDGDGHFHFRNLPAATYYIYALKDEGGQRRYTSEKNLFAFADSAVVVKEENEPVVLYAYNEKETTASVSGLSPGNRGGANNDREKRLRFETNTANGVFDQQEDFGFTFTTPLKRFDSARVSLYTDSFTKKNTIRFREDTAAKKIFLQTDWKENTMYALVLDKEFAQDTAGKMLLKSDTLNFRTRKLVEYGSLKVRFKNLDLSKNPVIQFLSFDKIVKSVPLSSADLFIPLFSPGEYDLRILYDENKNGKWDPGSFFGTKRQPELAAPIDRKLTVKANWDNEAEINL